MSRITARSGILPVLLFSFAGFLTMGYHPGAEDDGVYLAAVKASLNPGLFPHDSAFFKLQMRLSVFDHWMASFVRASGISVAWSELLWQSVAIVLVLWGCLSILCVLFDDFPARWGGMAAISAMLTLPVAGTSLYIADPYLHPRNLATALILLAVARILKGSLAFAFPLLIVALLLHPTMGAFGVSFCAVLALILRWRGLRKWPERSYRKPVQAVMPASAFVPLGWIFRQPSSDWLQAMSTRHWLWPLQWTWYEWLGAIGPLILLLLVTRMARRHGDVALERFATAVLIYGVLQQAVALILCAQHNTALATLEPMRYLHLLYIFLVLIGGAFLGRYWLRTSVLRWAVLLLIANGGMFLAQRRLFASTPHIELPDRSSRNPWLQAFAWIRTNTPPGAYFAAGAYYLAEPGDDMHSFRALAERSVLADALKDGSVVSKAPELAPIWRRQVEAQARWEQFQLADFERLRSDFGVDWVLLDRPPPHGLACAWHNGPLTVCQIP